MEVDEYFLGQKLPEFKNKIPILVEYEGQSDDLHFAFQPELEMGGR